MEFAKKTGEDSQPYKYNGKELDKELGLEMYDYSARYMDPAIGRFTSVDPLAEKYYSWSPYVYVGNNPIRMTDPNGKDWKDVVHGALSAISDNLSLGASASYSQGQQSQVSDASDYNVGRTIGDLISIAMGTGEVVAGGATTGGSALLVVPSGGTSAVGLAGGVAATTHGVGVIGKALESSGRISEMATKKGGNGSENTKSTSGSKTPEYKSPKSNI